MNEKQQSIFEEFRQEVYRLHARWDEFVCVFGTRNVVDYLNQEHPLAFSRIQDLMSDDLLLRVSRLRDPAKTGKFENLSVAGVIAELNTLLDDAAASEAQRLAETFASSSLAIETHRNKRIAHADRAVALNEMELETIPISSLRAAMKTLCDLLNVLAVALGEGQNGCEGNYPEAQAMRRLLNSLNAPQG